MIEINKIYQGNILDVLKTFEDDCIDCIITSPPYFELRSYSDNKEEIGKEEHPQEYINKIVEITEECMRVLKPTGVMFLNLGDSYGSHRDSKSSSFNIVSKEKIDSLIVKNRGKSGWFQEKQKLLIPHRIAIALQEKGLIIRDDITWLKKIVIYPDKESIGSCMPFPVLDKLLPATEYIFQIVKNKKYYFDLESVKTETKNSTIERAMRPLSSTYSRDINGNSYVHHKGMESYYNKIKDNYIDDNDNARRTRTKENLCVGKEDYTNWSVKGIDVSLANPTNALMFKRMNQNSKKAKQEHFASFPISLSDFFVKVGCPINGVVLDPFMGSGTTGLSALRNNRNFIGIELNPKFIEISYRRMKKYLEQRKLV